MSEPSAVEVVNINGASDIVLTCEHASHYMPARYSDLGLSPAQRYRHIAWDIGAEDVARRLSGLIDAPLFMSNYSRLLIDCNRPVGSPTSIPVMSETTEIPGNVGISTTERELRERDFYWPFQSAISDHLDARAKARRKTVLLAIHSFTPVFKGFARPWHGGILFRKSAAFGHCLVETLSEPGLTIAANEPYQISDDGDYTIPVHGEERSLDAVLVEIRQDLIADLTGANVWAQRLAKAINSLRL